MDRVPAAVHPYEWRDLPEGESRVLVGKLCHAYQDMIQLGFEEGGAFNIDITPPMVSELDMMLNPFFELGVRRAILARTTPCGWSATLKDVFIDVEGHGCTTQWSPGIEQQGPDILQPLAARDPSR